MSVWAIVPAKRYALAKSRLAPLLERAERSALARAMLREVLEVLGALEGLGGQLVLAGDAQVAADAEAAGAEISIDAPGQALHQRIDLALEALSRRGASAALVFMADLPLIRLAPLRGLVEALAAPSAEGRLLLVPDHRGEGTNVLGLRPPGAIRTSFGLEASLARHRQAALVCGLQVQIEAHDALSLDLDTPADWRSLHARGWHPSALRPR
ncbi:MAG: 2-phospho-L-lactate guanylyltransferase [Myxococcales bacterium]|nr:2-phospho-L-lactate guanylyltransferase [Myxococcales bacterium]